MQFGFPKEQRLCSRRIINGLASEGKVLFKYPFKAYYKPSEADVPRYVISVPKKSFKRAVWRNTLKRRTREAVRLNQKAVLDGFCADYLFVYIAREERSFEEIQAAVVDILTRSAKSVSSHVDSLSDEQAVTDRPDAMAVQTTSAESIQPAVARRPDAMAVQTASAESIQPAVARRPDAMAVQTMPTEAQTEAGENTASDRHPVTQSDCTDKRTNEEKQ